MNLKEFLVLIKEEKTEEINKFSTKFDFYLKRMELENGKIDFKLQLIEKGKYKSYLFENKETQFFEIIINDLYAGYYYKSANVPNKEGYVYTNSKDFWKNKNLFTQDNWANISEEKERFVIFEICKIICKIYNIENDIDYKECKEVFYSLIG